MKKVKYVMLMLIATFLITGCSKQNDSLVLNANVEDESEPVVLETVEEPASLPDEPELPAEEVENEEIIQPGKYEKVLAEENYRDETDWEKITKTFPEVNIKYTVQAVDDVPFITELYFIGIDNEGLAVALGSFTKTGGFLNSKGEEFIHDPYLKNDAGFFKDSLLGISVDAIDYPFSLNGIALTTDFEIYKTECLCRLSINCEEKTIEEWFPEL